MRKLLAVMGRAVLLLVLVGCAGELNTPGEALRLLGGSPGDAWLGEPYEATLRTAGGLRPYTFEIESGTLPPGLQLENGIIRGTPSELGDWTFTVTLSDANLSSTFLEHRLRVVELPPPALELVMPQTEARAPFTVRVSVADARDLLGLSSRLRWDPKLFSYVEGSLSASSESYALFSETGADWLQVDLAWLASTFSGERLLFSFQLSPAEPARPGLSVSTDFAVSTAAGSVFREQQSGARVPPVRVPEPEAAAPALGDAEEPAPEGATDSPAEAAPEEQPPAADEAEDGQ